MGGGQDKPAWTACPPGMKITRVGGKITWDSLPPGGQAVQGGKINCYTGPLYADTLTSIGHGHANKLCKKKAKYPIRLCANIADVCSISNL